MLLVHYDLGPTARPLWCDVLSLERRAVGGAQRGEVMASSRDAGSSASPGAPSYNLLKGPLKMKTETHETRNVRAGYTAQAHNTKHKYTNTD